MQRQYTCKPTKIKGILSHKLIQGDLLMDLLGFSPFDLNQRFELLNADLNAAQTKISELLSGNSTGDGADDPLRHIRLEGLRFERNTIRSKILDVSAIQHAREVVSQTREAVFFFQAHFSSFYQEIVDDINSGSNEEPGQDESAMLMQQIDQCYRTIEASHQDQVSMMTQIHQNSSKLAEMGDWIDRVNHALTKSRSFFSRKCFSIRKLREQLTCSLQDQRALQIYSLIAARHGHGFVEKLHQMIAAQKQLAA